MLVLGAVIVSTVFDVSYGVFGGLVRSRMARRSGAARTGARRRGADLHRARWPHGGHGPAVAGGRGGREREGGRGKGGGGGGGRGGGGGGREGGGERGGGGGGGEGGRGGGGGEGGGGGGGGGEGGGGGGRGGGGGGGGRRGGGGGGGGKGGGGREEGRGERQIADLSRPAGDLVLDRRDEAVQPLGHVAEEEVGLDGLELDQRRTSLPVNEIHAGVGQATRSVRDRTEGDPQLGRVGLVVDLATRRRSTGSDSRPLAGTFRTPCDNAPLKKTTTALPPRSMG